MHRIEKKYPLLSCSEEIQDIFITLYCEIRPICGLSSFISSNALIPARIVQGHTGHLQWKVGKDVPPWVQTGIIAPSQPGEVEGNSADDLAGEDSMIARWDGNIPFNSDGRRRF